MTIKEILLRGKEAKQRLEDPVFKEALRQMRDACYYNIEHSSYGSADEREDLYRMMRCISKFEEILVKMIQDGEFEDNSKNTSKIRKLIR